MEHEIVNWHANHIKIFQENLKKQAKNYITQKKHLNINIMSRNMEHYEGTNRKNNT